jgi:hypothetical protein
VITRGGDVETSALRQRSGSDQLGLFVAYLQSRFADNAHIWATALYEEVAELGYQGSRGKARCHCRNCPSAASKSWPDISDSRPRTPELPRKAASKSLRRDAAQVVISGIGRSAPSSWLAPAPVMTRSLTSFIAGRAGMRIAWDSRSGPGVTPAVDFRKAVIPRRGRIPGGIGRVSPQELGCILERRSELRVAHFVLGAQRAFDSIRAGP